MLLKVLPLIFCQDTPLSRHTGILFLFGFEERTDWLGREESLPGFHSLQEKRGLMNGQNVWIYELNDDVYDVPQDFYVRGRMCGFPGADGLSDDTKDCVAREWLGLK